MQPQNQLPPHHAPTSLKIILLIFALVLVGALAFFIYRDNTTPTELGGDTVKSPAKSSTTTTNSTASQKTYANTKYGYSFKYPDTAKLTASAGNSDNLAITETADGVTVLPASDSGSSNGIFYISVPGIDLTTTAIQGQFASTDPSKIAVVSATIGGNSGYKVTITGDASVTSTFYFVKNSAGTVLKLTVLDNNSTATSILDSFKFI